MSNFKLLKNDDITSNEALRIHFIEKNIAKTKLKYF